MYMCWRMRTLQQCEYELGVELHTRCGVGTCELSLQYCYSEPGTMWRNNVEEQHNEKC